MDVMCYRLCYDNRRAEEKGALFTALLMLESPLSSKDACWGGLQHTHIMALGGNDQST